METTYPGSMRGVRLPGGRQVEFVDVPIPEPGYSEVLVRMKASSICGSDIRAIYREHLGHGPEAYQDVIAGHEPSGQIVAAGPGCHRFGAGDRVILYHIAGCGVCPDCRAGYMISCTSPQRAAYGWQRDGGHADFLLAAEATCVPLLEPLTYVDGALIACGFGTAYEALRKANVSGRDRVLVTGMGPVGMAVGVLAKAMGARQVIGTDVAPERLAFALEVDAIDEGLLADEGTHERVLQLTDGRGCEVSIDCSGNPTARDLALRSTRRFGRCVMVGEGGRLDIDVSQVLIHPQITVMGSWVTSIGHMEELAELLVRWDVHPERIVSHRFALDDAAEAFRVADEGRSGKVCIVMP